MPTANPSDTPDTSPARQLPRLIGDWGALFAALTVAMVPVVIVCLVFYRQVQAGLTGGTLK